jgi:FkbM family methyltransferase
MLDIGWLIRNTATAWRHSPSLEDFGKRILYTYSHRLPGPGNSKEWSIGFQYRPPLGQLRFILRSNAGSDAFILSEVFEHEHYDLGLTNPPETILDLGANIGLTAVYFARVFPNARLACVEPISSNASILRKNLQLNSVDAFVFEAAVHVTDGEVRMTLQAKDYGHAIAEKAEPECSENVVVCKSLSVPSIMQRLGWPHIGLLKVDIEGHEKNLLAGNCEWLNSVGAMCIECHPGFGEGDLTRLAGRFGFLPPRQLRGIWLMTRLSPSTVPS